MDLRERIEQAMLECMHIGNGYETPDELHDKRVAALERLVMEQVRQCAAMAEDYPSIYLRDVSIGAQEVGDGIARQIRSEFKLASA